MAFCSPIQTINQNRINNSCFDTDSIDEMIELYNKSSNNKIDTSLSHEEKLKLLESHLKESSPCCEEWCLLESEALKPLKKKFEEYFRPVVPKKWLDNKRTWLNTLDIEAEMLLYSKAYPEFQFLSVTPIDFDLRIRRGINSEECVDENLCKLNIKDQFSSGKKYIAAVFNLDKHNQSGSHWTAFFVSLKLGESYYYDSVANFMPKEVVELINRITNQGNELIEKGEMWLENTKTRFKTIFHKKDGNNVSIPIVDICNYLLLKDHFMLYRFASILNEKPFEFNMKRNDELIKLIFNKTLELIDKTNDNRYVKIPDLSKIIESVESRNIKVDDFAENWVNNQLGIAMNNFILSIRLLMDEENTFYHILKYGVVYDNIILELDKPLNKTSSRLTDMSFKMHKNYVQHQFKNTECGMYTINFIDSFLTKNKTFHEIIQDAIHDDEMNKLRYTKYYRPRSKKNK
jgi:hypothetical protein